MLTLEKKVNRDHITMKILFNIFLMLLVSMPFLSLATNFSETCEDGSGETGSGFGIGFGLVLEFGLYRTSCPEAESIIYSWVENAVIQDPRMAASLLRLHFHDCFVNASHLISYFVLVIFVNYKSLNRNPNHRLSIHEYEPGYVLHCRDVMLRSCWMTQKDWSVKKLRLRILTLSEDSK